VSLECKNVLESYFYIKGKPVIEELIRRHCYKHFLLDSGAFTYLAQKQSGKSVNVDWDEYLTGYIKFIKDNDIDEFFELDIDSVVGLRKVEEMRSRLEIETGKKCIPVWHFSRGKDYYIQMCKDYDYIAFGGIITDGVSTKEILKYLPWFTQTAHKYKCKVHGLGLTCAGVEKYGLDSCDSTTWISGSRFGQMAEFDGTRVTNVTRASKMGKRVYDSKAIDVYNFKEWLKYQLWLERF
jgi:hypothetical protein